ncbi:MAG TPA: hypothetical protein VGL86_18020, partial [Polyangia bacterium]
MHRAAAPIATKDLAQHVRCGRLAIGHLPFALGDERLDAIPVIGRDDGQLGTVSADHFIVSGATTHNPITLAPHHTL